MLLQSEDLGSNPSSTTYFPGEVTSFAPLASVRSTTLTLSPGGGKGPRVHGGVEPCLPWDTARQGAVGHRPAALQGPEPRTPHSGKEGSTLLPLAGTTGMTSLGYIPGRGD